MDINGYSRGEKNLCEIQGKEVWEAYKKIVLGKIYELAVVWRGIQKLVNAKKLKVGRVIEEEVRGVFGKRW